MFTHRERIGSVDLAFTDRFGGVSEAPYDELDLALPTPDRVAESEANWQRVMAEFAPGGKRVDMRQVHGSVVTALEGPKDPAPECDGLVTVSPDTVLVVRVADCVPVLLADPGAGVVAAAHVGRAGLASDVLGVTLDQMVAAGARTIVARIGPHVCGRCYEVPAALQREVEALVPGAAATTSWGTPSLDLAAGVRSQLARPEVAEVAELGVCTKESPDHYSHRRDAERSGRQVGLIMWRGRRVEPPPRTCRRVGPHP
ncbi:peptidoglycan editing factor PgeF [Nocardioides alcanivorans]|uniref:peptidoglycan editing factor PgeF n=1 Tax=Nocardioides alcanivorans TaxID=2897352 RepID=UPI001F3E18C4|nr:peptidoglycan editing factor PgeF [Nocardioides alcanivorans]